MWAVRTCVCLQVGALTEASEETGGGEKVEQAGQSDRQQDGQTASPPAAESPSVKSKVTSSQTGQSGDADGHSYYYISLLITINYFPDG